MGEIDLERTFLPVVLKEQEMIINNIDKLNFDEGDILAQMLQVREKERKKEVIVSFSS